MNETFVLNADRNVTLSAYIVSDRPAPSVLIAPGGGYLSHSEWESEPVAKAYNERGYNAFILRYSVGEHYKWPYPLDDFNQAMEYITANARELNVDAEHIIAVGFSAGGHLVSVAASLATRKLFAAVICYGVTMSGMLKNAPDAADACDAVSTETCPCFIAASRTDWIVPIQNTNAFVRALDDNFVDYELHVYGYAPHGFALGDAAEQDGACGRVGNWFRDSVDWLDELMSGKYVSIKEYGEYNDRFGTEPGLCNSCGKLFSQPEVADLMLSFFPEQYAVYQAAKSTLDAILNVDSVSMKSLLRFFKTPPSILSKIEAALTNLFSKK